MRPKFVVDYNKGKPGIDLSDQLLAYYTCLRRSKKWHLKWYFQCRQWMLIWFTKKIIIQGVWRYYSFVKVLCDLSFLMTIRKSGPGECPTNQMKCKLANHKLKAVEEFDRDVRRRCAGYNARIRQQKLKEASNALAKKVKMSCSDCGKFYCL